MGRHVVPLGGEAVALLHQDVPIPIDQDGPERVIAAIARLPGNGKCFSQQRLMVKFGFLRGMAHCFSQRSDFGRDQGAKVF